MTYDESRAEFEAWRIKRIRSATGRHPSTHTDLELRAMFLGFDHAAGVYTSAHEQHRWEAWQAASGRLVLGSEPVALLWQHAITGEQFVNLKNQDVPVEPNLFLVGLLCLATVASVPTESTPDPRRAAAEIGKIAR